MATATADEKASWPPPNFVNPENRHGLVIGLTTPTLALALICEYLRPQNTHWLAVPSCCICHGLVARAQ